MPEGAVTSGIQRITTVTRKGSLNCAHIADLREGGGPKLHGMQALTPLQAGAGLLTLACVQTPLATVGAVFVMSAPGGGTIAAARSMPIWGAAIPRPLPKV